jgi:hypothetical protein
VVERDVLEEADIAARTSPLLLSQIDCNRLSQRKVVILLVGAENCEMY